MLPLIQYNLAKNIWSVRHLAVSKTDTCPWRASVPVMETETNEIRKCNIQGIRQCWMLRRKHQAGKGRAKYRGGRHKNLDKVARRLSLREELWIKSRGSNREGRAVQAGEQKCKSAEKGVGLALSQARKEQCVAGAESARLKVAGKRKWASHAGSCKNVDWD